MSDERTTRVFLVEDGTLREGSPDGPPARGETDWDRLDAMTDEEALRAAESDPDAPPLTARHNTLPLKSRAVMTVSFSMLPAV